jgi:hypothetical protein
MTYREEQRLYKDCKESAKQFVGHPGVRDIEFGLKHRDGKLTSEISLRFKVDEKKPGKALKQDEILPKKVGKFTTDVLNHTIIQHQQRSENPRSNLRPLLGGAQIQSGVYQGTSNWGTMGCFYAIQDKILGFTNYHVLFGGASPEEAQQYYAGKLQVFQNLNRPGNLIGMASDLFSPDLDFATFVLQIPVDQSQSINSLSGLLTSWVFPRINTPVLKSGACTGVTYGIIDGRSCIDSSELSIHLDQKYSNPSECISDYGDSGSVWILNDGSEILKPVALHYAGGDTPQWAKAKSFASIFASIQNKLRTKNS